MHELKAIPKDTEAAALEKAKHYRMLNDPRAAESICLDVLALAPGNREAQKTLLLALTDQFGMGHGIGSQRAREVLTLIEDAYEAEYYCGVICEREAMALLTRRGPRSRYLAYDGLRSAMESYSRAAEIRPDAPDPILRWNSCARVLNASPHLAPEPEHLGQDMIE